MARKSSLYNLVQAAQKKNDNNKVRLGYTANDYNVLGALEKAYYEIVRIQQQGGEVTPAGTFSASTGLSAGQEYSVMSSANNLAIKVEAGSNWTNQFQGKCWIRSYMSFYVTDSNKNGTYHVPVGNPEDKNCLYYGDTVLGNFSFPSIDPQVTRTNQFERDDYIVGVGLDFDNYVIPYLKKFYNEDGGNWQVNTLRTVASKLQMFAEILFPKKKPKYTSQQDGGKFEGDYHVLHCPVTVDCNVPDMKFHLLWFPCPLLFINDFSSLGVVSMKKIENGQESNRVTVGKDGLSVPFSSSKYKHKQALIKGFSHSAFKDVNDTIFEQVGVDFLASQDQSVVSFVRIFFDNAAESELKLNSSLSQQQRQNLFKGAYDASQFVQRSVVNVGDVGGAQLEYWNEFGKEIGLSGGLVERAVGAIGRFESGGNWGHWDWAHDNQGISAGFLQFTQVAGGIKDYRDFYKELQSTDSSAPPMSDGMYNDIGKYNGLQNWQPLKKYASEFASQAATNAGKMAQILAWEGRGNNKLKRKYTVKWFKAFKCSSAAQLMAIFGAINHLPTWFNGQSPWSGKGYPRWLGQNIPTDPIQKAKWLEAIHWIEYKEYNKKCAVSATKNTIYEFMKNIQGYWSGSANRDGHKRRMITSYNLWGTDNVNLDGWNTFKW